MDLASFFPTPKTVAIVGLSDNPDRPSHEVALYLLEHHFNIIPVNPNHSSILGHTSYPSITAIPKEIPIDIVDIFRKPPMVPEVIRDIIYCGRKPMIWMQEGVVSEEAKQIAEGEGLTVFMDICLMKTHRRQSGYHKIL